MKCKIIHDTLSLVAPQDWSRPPPRPRSAPVYLLRQEPHSYPDDGIPNGTPKTVGCITLLYDETEAIERGRARREAQLLSSAHRRSKRHTMLGYMDRPVSAHP